eukprot:6185296-Pleurochrysis_carterae.AAC.2
MSINCCQTRISSCQKVGWRAERNTLPCKLYCKAAQCAMVRSGVSLHGRGAPPLSVAQNGREQELGNRAWSAGDENR